jgi:tetratricopeptide (TPR) repeat protein
MHQVGPVLGPVPYVSARTADVRYISDEFSSLQGRFVRWELGAWCAAISQALPKADGLAEGRLGAIASCFRETILVAEQLERFDDARSIAERAIRYFSGLAGRERRADAVAHAVSALVWLGRSERLAGRIDDALLHLGRVRSLGFGAEISVGPLHIKRAQWDSVIALEAEMARVVAFDSAVELFSTLLAAGQYDEVVSLALVARRGPQDPPALDNIRKEAALSALCRLGCPDEALSLATRYSMEARENDKLVFELRRAEVLACFGDLPKARRVLESVCTVLEQRWRAHPACVEEIWIAVRATRVYSLISEAMSIEFHWTALEEALFVGDVPLAIELLERIAKYEWDEERRADAADLLRAVGMGSGYRLASAKELLSPDEAPLSGRTVEERAPGFGALVEWLETFGQGK